MSWKKTTVCGRVMFEREDGVRVESDEQIRAIEDHERGDVVKPEVHGYPVDEEEPAGSDDSGSWVGDCVAGMVVITLIAIVIALMVAL